MRVAETQPFSLLLFNFKSKNRKDLLIKWGILAAISVGFAYLYYSVQRLSPYLHIVDEKNAIFVYPFSEWIIHPLRFFWGNLKGMWDWVLTYTTWPILILILSSFFIKIKFTREKLILFSWFIFPFIALALFGNILYPRFVLFMTMPLLVLAAFSMNEILKRLKRNYYKVFVVGVFIGALVYLDYSIINNFARARIPYLDSEQYVNGWPAGGGTNEIIEYLRKESKKGKIYVASLGTFGSLPTYAVEIYLGDNKNIGKGGIYPVPSEMPKDLLEKAKTMPVYIFVSNQEEFEKQITTWPIKELLKYQKGIGKSYAYLYEVKI